MTKAIFFENYFLGKDQLKWASGVKSFKQIYYQNLYKGIHLKSFSDKNNFRYDYVVDAGGRCITNQNAI